MHLYFANYVCLMKKKLSYKCTKIFLIDYLNVIIIMLRRHTYNNFISQSDDIIIKRNMFKFRANSKYFIHGCTLKK